MSPGIKQIARVAIFAALFFVLSYTTVFIPNVNPGFFVVFTISVIWGILPGFAVAAAGMFLWSNFNPMGPAPFPIMIAQIIGTAAIAPIGYLFGKIFNIKRANIPALAGMILAGLLSGAIYQLAVVAGGAVIVGSFMASLLTGQWFILTTVISNAIIFPLLYPALVYLGRTERK